jgi:hypothetical protein
MSTMILQLDHIIEETIDSKEFSMKYVWRLWAKALGEKATPNDKEADIVATIRTCIVLIYILTNIFIIAGIVRHWNDVPTQLEQKH